jgi:hypothetical protein
MSVPAELLWRVMLISMVLVTDAAIKFSGVLLDDSTTSARQIILEANCGTSGSIRYTLLATLNDDLEVRVKCGASMTLIEFDELVSVNDDMTIEVDNKLPCCRFLNSGLYVATLNWC